MAPSLSGSPTAEPVLLEGSGKFEETSVFLEKTFRGRRGQDGEHMYTCSGFISIFGKTNTIL